MTPSTLRLRMVADDLPAGHALSAALAWPHRLEDWALMLRLGEGVVAEVADGGVAGTALAWRYGTDTATVGMIIVSERLQCRGLGRAMLRALLDRRESRTVRLNATKEGLKLYEALGLRPVGTVTQYPSTSLPAFPLERFDVRALGPADLSWITALDRQASGMDRTNLLAALLEHGWGIARDETGFALTRRFGRGHLVGPVVASDRLIAQVLVAQLLASLEGEHVRIDIPERQASTGWLLQRGFVQAGSVVTMKSRRRTASEESAANICTGEPGIWLPSPRPLASTAHSGELRSTSAEGQIRSA